MNAKFSLPNNLEAEMTLLGSVFFNPDCLIEISEILITPDYFYSTHHQKIYKSMLSMFYKNKPIDAVTLSEKLNQEKNLESIGGLGYLSELVDKVATYRNVVYYAEIIKEKYIKRKLIQKSNEIIQNCMNDIVETDNIVMQAERDIINIGSNVVKTDFLTPSDILPSLLEKIEKNASNDGKLTGLDTGNSKLNRLTNGLQPTDYVILAARPSMGKTSLALQITYITAKQGKPVLVFSKEMPPESLVTRIACSIAGIAYNKIMSGKMTDLEWSNFTNAVDEINELPIYFDNSNSYDPYDFMIKSKRIKRDIDLQLIVVDYLGMLHLKNKEKGMNRQQELTEISRTLKNINTELNVTVLALSQLSRSLETRLDKRPILSDLRESGAIEQDADLCLMLYKDCVYNPNKMIDINYEGIDYEISNNNLAEIIIRKHRNGELGTCLSYFSPERMIFKNVNIKDLI